MAAARLRPIAFVSLSTFLAIVFAHTVSARIILNTIDANAVVTDNGRHVIVTGPIVCDSGERAEIRVTVTQRTTGALAEGLTRVICTGLQQRWKVHAAAQANESFEEGAARAVGLARTSDRASTTDAHQWLVDIALAAD
jgi:hypothetical protein